MLAKKRSEVGRVPPFGQTAGALVACRAIQRKHLGGRFTLVDTDLSLGQHRKKPGA
jgi:hypothetical protein